MLNSIAKKLIFGFGIVLVLSAASSIAAYIRMEELVHKAIPFDSECSQLGEHLEHSLSAFPAQLLVGEGSFMKDHQKQRDEINKSLKHLDQLKSALSRQHQEDLVSLNDQFESLKGLQDELLPVDGKAKPEEKSFVSSMLTALTNMIDKEAALEATPERKDLLNSLANSRGSLSIAVGDIRTFLLTGQPEFKEQFQTQWNKNSVAFQSINGASGEKGMRHLLTKDQDDEWQSYLRHRMRFENVFTMLFAIRDQASTIESGLQVLQERAKVERERAAEVTTTTLIVSTLLAIGFGCMVAVLLSRSISQRVAALAHRADEIAAGDLDTEPLANNSPDELGRLAGSFNVMSQNLREMIGTMTSQEETLASEARAQAIFSAAADGLITIGTDGVIQSFNPAAEKLFGYQASEAVGRKVNDLMPSPFKEEHDEYLERYLRTGVAQIIGRGRELQGVRKDGTQFDLWLRVIDLKLGDETIFIGTIQDISDRKRKHNAIKDAVVRLTTSMKEILATTSQQAHGATQQTAAVSETTSTVDELRRIAEQSAERTSLMATSAQKTDEESETGQRAVEESITAMSEVRSRVDSLAKAIGSLGQKAQHIGDITEKVNDIADQTNMLALNAAVEAARAGEHGKGFAVVAEEVKKLANDAKKATNDVGQILEQISKATETAVMSAEQGTNAAKRASEVVIQAGDSIRSLKNAIGDSATIAHQISTSASQQATGVSQLHEGMRSIDRVAKENLMAIQQIESAAQNLHQLSDELRQLTAADSS